MEPWSVPPWEVRIQVLEHLWEQIREAIIKKLKEEKIWAKDEWQEVIAAREKAIEEYRKNQELKRIADERRRRDELLGEDGDARVPW
ncbi:hypothetical protein BJ508DRAFT_414138 [Ascobolus immersus RN42]|uniref:Uncharacterized protein n=1 Tax=Ascobolus immersus RN42 TaxID=1160509 RepID=A0A3N4IC84_ASCIM|nr:hypothetical protein BJ508DRAFT_414138 [Ascobolus immersus RN42]